MLNILLLKEVQDVLFTMRQQELDVEFHKTEEWKICGSGHTSGYQEFSGVRSFQHFGHNSSHCPEYLWSPRGLSVIWKYLKASNRLS